MEKLMFVSLNIKWENNVDISLNDRLPSDSDGAVDDFLKEFESDRLAQLASFQGTRLLKW